MNSCNFVGRISNDPKLYTSQSGSVYCQFDLAVRRKKVGHADFIHCIGYDVIAKIVPKYTKKGDKVGVCGRLQSRSWFNADGTPFVSFVIVVDTVDFLERKPDGDPEEKEEFAFAEEDPWDDLK